MDLPSDLNKRRPLPFGVFGRDRLYSRESVLHLQDTVISTSIVSLSQRLQASTAYGAKVA